tara:strand:+ start:1110 stop:1337 length:228 start_codon:yes stop_codon:yes gene_type:complete
MDKWEYEVISLTIRDPGYTSASKKISENSIKKDLNRLGRQGWEMVQTVSRYKHEYIILKRKQEIVTDKKKEKGKK